MQEQEVLKRLGLELKELKKILAKNLNMKSSDIIIEYDTEKKGVFRINKGEPFIKLEEVECFDEHKTSLSKGIFYGLPILNPLILHGRPIGGDVCLATNLYTEPKKQNYPKKRSSRYQNFNPVGYSNKNKQDWRKGHILFAWLVDRFFHEVKFSPAEKKMMYFTHAKTSNEPVESKSEIYNHFRYEEMLQKWLEQDEVPFQKFRYSVRLIYQDELSEVPIATLLQLVTDNPESRYQFNILAPNVEI